MTPDGEPRSVQRELMAGHAARAAEAATGLTSHVAPGVSGGHGRTAITFFLGSSRVYFPLPSSVWPTTAILPCLANFLIPL